MARQGAEAGFTLIEVLLTLALVAGLCALSFTSLGQPQVTASLAGTLDTLVADLRSQQLLAMTGNGDAGSAQPHGIVIASDHYTLFAGTSFDSGDDANYTVTPGEGISLDTDFPDEQIVFSQGTGEVRNFSSGHTITVDAQGQNKTISINPLGMAEVE